MGIRPIRDHVVVQRLEGASKTAGGIFIPDAHKEKLHEGVVVAVGTGRTVGGKHYPPEVAVGEKVLWAKFRGAETKYRGEDVVILLEEDILAVIG